MTRELEGRDNALRSALMVAQKNENRWIGLYPECAGGSESIERWSETAKLRRREVERIEELLADNVKTLLARHDFGNRHTFNLTRDGMGQRESEK